MNKLTTLAFIVWAIDVDGMSLPVIQALERFRKSAEGVQRIFTDPSDKLTYCEKVVNMNPLDFFTEYVLFYAKSEVESGIRGYGKYNTEILNYKLS